MKASSGYIQLIEHELKERQKRNPTYSLRAFARSLGISPAMLSQILNGKRPITPRAALLLADALPFSEAERREFLRASFHSKNPPETQKKWKSYFTDFDPEEFLAISEPVHFSILALGGLSYRRWDPDWIAERLSTSPEIAADAMGRLEKLKLVEIEGTSFRPSVAVLRVQSEVKDIAIQTFHKQTLLQAINSLEHDKVEEREFNSITLAIDSSQLEKAKELTFRYLENIHSLLDKATERDRAYTISVQMFPASSPSEGG